MDPVVAFAIGLLVGAALLAGVATTVGRPALRRLARAAAPRVPVDRGEALVWGYRFPESVWTKLRAAHPELHDDHVLLIEQGLREWLTLAVHARGRSIGMPSTTVDWAWHEFVLHGAAYRAFCDRVLGRPFDHQPAAVMGRPMPAALEDARELWSATRRACEGHEAVLWRCDAEVRAAVSPGSPA